MTDEPFPGSRMQPMSPAVTPGAMAPVNDPLKIIALVVHGLYAASFFTGFTSVIGVVIAYIKRPDARGTIFESHFTYAIRTFWIGLVFGSVFLLLSLALIGLPLLGLLAIWYIVRVVRPILAAIDDKPVVNPTGYF